MFKKIKQFFAGEPEGFISEYDKFITSRKFKLSESQKREIAQHKVISKLRDPASLKLRRTSPSSPPRTPSPSSFLSTVQK